MKNVFSSETILHLEILDSSHVKKINMATNDNLVQHSTAIDLQELYFTIKYYNLLSVCFIMFITYIIVNALHYV